MAPHQEKLKSYISAPSLHILNSSSTVLTRLSRIAHHHPFSAFCRIHQANDRKHNPYCASMTVFGTLSIIKRGMGFLVIDLLLILSILLMNDPLWAIAAICLLIFPTPNPNTCFSHRRTPSTTGNISHEQLLGGSVHSVNSQQQSDGMAATPQAQPPRLNDALRYIDEVHVRFIDQPDVCLRFLDIMNDFDPQAPDLSDVIQRVSSLFVGHPELIKGLNAFLPPGYRLVYGTRDDPYAIQLITPKGTIASLLPMDGQQRP